MKLITAKRDLLALLADEGLRLSVWNGKAAVVRRDEFNTPVARVQNGLPTKMRDADLMFYNGGYELTEKGKAQIAKQNR